MTNHFQWLLILLAGSTAWADAFERLEGQALAELAERPEAKQVERLTMADLAALPNLAGRAGSAFVLVNTDQGNFSKVLAEVAFRRAPGREDQLVPILLIERFATFEAPTARNRLAQGRDVMLFDGFEYDLDSGQVVPTGQGGDIRFQVEEGAEPLLEPVGEARLWTFSKRPKLPGPGPGEPSPGRGVVPNDFEGRFRLFADGMLSGVLDLEVEGREVSGRFRSEQTGTSYPLSGEIPRDTPQRVRFRVEFPQSHQEYDGYLFAQGKGAIAGTMAMLGRTVGFFAVRDHGRFAPEGDEFELEQNEDDSS